MEKRLEAPLFFEAEKNNRHVFNLDSQFHFALRLEIITFF